MITHEHFCSKPCTQKNLRDQIIEGLLDTDTVETLLHEPNLTLATTIQAQEAENKHTYVANQQPETIAALQRHRNQRSLVPIRTCPGCRAAVHPGGHSQCPAYGQTCFHCQKVGHFAKVCCSKPSSPSPCPTSAQTPASTPTVKHLTISNLKNVTTNEPAPLVKVLSSQPMALANYKPSQTQVPTYLQLGKKPYEP